MNVYPVQQVRVRRRQGHPQPFRESSMRSRSTSLIAFIAGLALAGTASAADLGGSKDGGGYAGDEWALEGVRVGGVLIIAPTYEGSDEYEVLGAPYILPLFAGGGPGWLSRFDARGLDDIRFNAI